MTYLLLRYSSLGNVAMLTPLVWSLSKNHPNDRFIIVAKKRLGAMFFGMENVEFLEIDTHTRGLMRSMWLYKELKKHPIDVVIDLQDVWLTKLIRWLYMLHKCPVHVITSELSNQHTALVRGYRGEPLRTEIERYEQTFNEAGLKTDRAFTSLDINHDALNKVQQQYGKKNGQWIGIAPFAKHKSNILPYRTIKEVIHHLSKQENTRIYLFGAGKIESEMLRQWASLYPNVVCVAGLLPLEEELELMRQLDLMICMDSANQHLASLVGLRAITIWLATHPQMGFYPWKQNTKDCIQTPLSCRPCTLHGTEKCKFRNFACKEISAEDIIKNIRWGL